GPAAEGVDRRRRGGPRRPRLIAQGLDARLVDVAEDVEGRLAREHVEEELDVRAREGRGQPPDRGHHVAARRRLELLDAADEPRVVRDLQEVEEGDDEALALGEVEVREERGGELR